MKSWISKKIRAKKVTRRGGESCKGFKDNVPCMA